MSPEALYARGRTLRAQGQFEAAAAAYREALALRPQFAEAMVSLGIAYKQLGRYEEAVACQAEAIALRPGMPEAWLNRALALQQANRFVEAESGFREAMGRFPDSAHARAGLASLLHELGRFDEAAANYTEAAVLAPTSAEILSGCGIVLRDAGRARAGLAMLERALAADPNHAMAEFSAGTTQLLLGEFAPGWRRFEARFRAAPHAAAFEAPGAPRWSGGPLRGRTILLTAEQGLGDVLQFVRYVPLLSARGARVRLLAQPPLLRLLERVEGVERVFGTGEAPHGYDLHCPMMSVPHLLDTRLETVPGKVPYLRVEPARQRAWGAKLGAACGLKVGLVWSGDPRPDDRGANLTDARRSVTLAQYAPLARVPGIRWVSLQKGAPAAQAKRPPAGMHLLDLMDEAKDFADTAALVQNLDLVITVDTSMAHLVGGLGKPVWMLSRFDGCWRWMLGRSDSPWYPSMRIFRQHAPLDWGGALDALARALDRQVAR